METKSFNDLPKEAIAIRTDVFMQEQGFQGSSKSVTRKYGKTYNVEHYDLDMIISVGYRVKSQRGVEFRRWANS